MAVAVVICDNAGAAFIVTGDIADKVIRSDGTVVDSLVGRVGASSSGGSAQGSRVVVYVFRLPDPGPGQTPVVLAADLQFTIVQDFANGAYNMDLHGIPARKSSAVLLSDSISKGESPENSRPLLIDDNLIPAAYSPATPVVKSLTTSGRQKLVEYLNDQYAASGGGIGSYVFLRLAPDVDPGVADTGINVAMAESTADAPRLIIEIPEANVSCAMVALLGLKLSQRRRRPAQPAETEVSR